MAKTIVVILIVILCTAAWTMVDSISFKDDLKKICDTASLAMEYGDQGQRDDYFYGSLRTEMKSRNGQKILEGFPLISQDKHYAFVESQAEKAGVQWQCAAFQDFVNSLPY